MKQFHIYFSGNVQGIGFRYTAKKIAENLGITGWVQNLPDGHVELIAQGDDKTFEIFIAKLAKQFSSYIQNTNIHHQKSDENFDSFSIRF